MNPACSSPCLCYASIFCHTNKAMDIQSLGGYIILSVYLQPFINHDVVKRAVGERQNGFDDFFTLAAETPFLKHIKKFVFFHNRS